MFQAGCLRAGLCWVCWWASLAVTASESRFEIGVGMGGQILNSYRGSHAEQATVLPIPYGVYRGNFFKVDEARGARGEVVLHPHVVIDISADVALRSGNSGGTLRGGMPELSTALQLGPSFNFNITGPDLDQGWLLRVPFRAVFTVQDFPFSTVGFTANPKLTYRRVNMWGAWRLSADIGGLFGSQSFHDYYYTVSPEYSTLDRPVYKASEGFSGLYTKLGLISQRGQFSYGVSIRYDHLKGAAFHRSPLVETDHYWVVSAGVAWRFFQSGF